MNAFDNIVPVASLVSVLALLWLLYTLKRRKTFLQPDIFKSAPLIEKETVTYNTSRYRFAIGSNVKLGLPVGQHISFKYVDGDGKEVMRPYTPVTGNDVLGHVDFVIKTYPKGRMSQHVDHLSIKSTILMRGPKGRFQYRRGMKRAFGMVAGGTGITPMYQVMREIAHDPQDNTKVSLLFANVSLQDILLKDELDDLAKQHPKQIQVTYVLDDAPEGWSGETGYVTANMMREHCPAPAEDAMLLFCGPRPMTQSLEAAAKEVGYAQGQTFTF